MSEDILLKDAEDEANQAVSAGQTEEQRDTLFDGQPPETSAAETPGDFQQTMLGAYPHAERIMPLEDPVHRGSHWPKDRIQNFNDLPVGRKEELRGTNAEHFPDVSPLDFDPLHETHNGVTSDGKKFSMAPMWVRLLDSFFTDGVSKKHKEKEYAWEKEYIKALSTLQNLMA